MVDHESVSEISAFERAMGLAIRSRRRALGLTQSDLAGLMGFTPIHMCRLERGRHHINLALLYVVSVYLETTPSALSSDAERLLGA
jgi:transcriptional regulator with XRE-family HTH domain